MLEAWMRSSCAVALASLLAACASDPPPLGPVAGGESFSYELLEGRARAEGVAHCPSGGAAGILRGGDASALSPEGELRHAVAALGARLETLCGRPVAANLELRHGAAAAGFAHLAEDGRTLQTHLTAAELEARRAEADLIETRPLVVAGYPRRGLGPGYGGVGFGLSLGTGGVGYGLGVGPGLGYGWPGRRYGYGWPAPYYYRYD
jgi:hypothetical protein